MPLGTNHITNTTHAALIPDIWSKEIQVATRELLTYAERVRRFDADAANGGKQIRVPNISNLTATAKVAQTPVDYESPTETTTNIDINNHFYVAFIVEDLTETQTPYGLTSIYTDQSAFALSKEIDTDVANLYTGLSTTPVGNGANPLDLTGVLEGIRTLDSADVPANDRYLGLTAAAKEDLLSIGTIQEFDKAGTDQGLRRGIIGDLFGVEVFWTNQTPVVTTVAQNIMFQMEAFGLAMQLMPRTQTENDIDYLGTKVVIDSLWGVQTMRPDFGVVVQSLNS